MAFKANRLTRDSRRGFPEDRAPDQWRRGVRRLPGTLKSEAEMPAAR
jgi:hypothetical protein